MDSDPARVATGAFALDLSELGARVRARLQLKPGQIVMVVPQGQPSAGIRSQVIWVSEPHGEGEAGLAFLEPLNSRL